jgi:hypothetical protein
MPSPTLSPSLTDPALGANSYLRVMVLPQKTQCNLPGTAKKWVLLWYPDFSFKFSYTFGLSIKKLPPNIDPSHPFVAL